MNVKAELFLNTVEKSKNKVRSCKNKAHLYSRIKKSAVETGFKEWLCVYCGKIVESS